MKKMFSNSPIVLLVLSLVLFSFSSDLGGDTYEIHLNGKLLLQQQVWKQTSVPAVSLEPKTSEGEIAVYYNHCGQPGKGRSLSIQNEAHSVLKEWRFDDTKTGEHTPMTCSLKNIAALTRKHGKLNLYYTSRELPDGKQLASLSMGGDVSSRK